MTTVASKASPSEVRVFLTKLYRFFDERHKIKFRKLSSDYHGFITWASGTVRVTIDPRKEVFATLIHEAMHYIYPEWSEERVLKKEAGIVNALTDRQVKNIIKRFAQSI